jgi:hypothetical protein
MMWLSTVILALTLYFCLLHHQHTMDKKLDEIKKSIEENKGG